MTSHFRDTGYFGKKRALEDLQMIYIWVSIIHKSQISVCFALRPVVFEIQGISREVHGMIQMTLNPTRSNVPYICITSTSESQISLRFALRPTIFEIRGILPEIEKIRNTPFDLKFTKFNCKKYPVYSKYLLPRPKFWSVSLYGYMFLRHKIIENPKCTDWAQTDLEYLTVKVPHIH